jgi:hypothetical protein
MPRFAHLTPESSELARQPAAIGKKGWALAATATAHLSATLGSMFSRESLTADLLLEPPRAYTVSLYCWLRSAAVVAEISNAGMIVRSRDPSGGHFRKRRRTHHKHVRL